MTTENQQPVAVGVTDHEVAVLEYAAAEADRAGCQLRLVHAYSVPPTAMDVAYGYDIPAAFRLEGEQLLREAKSYVGTGMDRRHIKCVLSQGIAPDVLQRESKTARVMVVGQDPPKPWYFRLYEGRSAHHLAEYSHCPVVIVPRNWAETPELNQVVVFVDGPDTARPILEFALMAASDRGASLKVVHIADEDPLGYERWHATKDVVDELPSAYRDVDVQMVVDHGNRPKVVLEAARDASLVVVGQPHVEHRFRPVSHSLARAVISRAACPVAVVPVGHKA